MADHGRPAQPGTRRGDDRPSPHIPGGGCLFQVGTALKHMELLAAHGAGELTVAEALPEGGRAEEQARNWLIGHPASVPNWPFACDPAAVTCGQGRRGIPAP